MNFQQLEYILAVDSTRHFVSAAEKCNVTQATLSMMIKKLEDEIGVRIFDRSKSPVIPTDIGEKILTQARIVLLEKERIEEIIQEEQGELRGQLRIGIIPTLAPYLLPLFLNDFLRDYPLVSLQVSELTTEEIIKRLTNYDLDAGMLAIPLHHPGIEEQHLFYEEFVLYGPSEDAVMRKKFILPKDIDINRLWLLEEGHCLRDQVINFCELKNKEKELHQLDFAAGSIETLRRMVEMNQGMTILPSLSLQYLSPARQKNVRQFKRPAPVRQIGLVSSRLYVKEKLLAALRDSVLARIPEEMKKIAGREVVEIE